ncbi:hypothetical protein EIP86_008120 [Pleurotus ostreatoroseus]|nr:hypothetical protein EIP86_008120 [Pleurotus ostreatoroseus]
MDPSDATTQAPSLTRKPTAAWTDVPLPPLPSSILEESPIAQLHAALASSPFLEPGTLLVTEPIPTALGPALPRNEPKGRRKRGRTYSGEGIPDSGTGLWRWVVLAQVKDGTEGRGAIESVMRVVRKTLLSTEPPLALPHNHKRRVSDGWSMLDVGEFAVHIVSRAARERYFPAERRWQTIWIKDARLICVCHKMPNPHVYSYHISQHVRSVVFYASDTIRYATAAYLADHASVMGRRTGDFPEERVSLTAVDQKVADTEVAPQQVHQLLKKPESHTPNVQVLLSIERADSEG